MKPECGNKSKYTLIMTESMEERKGTASENGYFGLADIDESTVEDAMSQCPCVFRRLGE